MSEPKHTPGPYSIEYHAYPCPKDGHGEPNPPAAFILPTGSDEAIALVFGQGDDPFDSPSQRANARLMASAPALLRELTHLVRLMHSFEGRLDIPDLATLNGARKAIEEASGE